MRELVFTFATLLLAACGTTTPSTTQVSFSEKEYEIAAKTTSFSTKLFHEVYKAERGNDNFCISPASVSWALSMAANGAKGSTAKELYETMGFGALAPDSINIYHQKSFNRLAILDSAKVKIGIANSVWVEKNFTVKKEFIKRNSLYYGAAVENVTFDAATVKRINSWCSEKTEGKITEIVKELNPSTRMMLINALYFNGRWTSPFTKSLTKEENFTKESGETVNVQMMHQKFNTQYYEDENVQMVSKPFGRGLFSLYLILPRQGVAMDKAAAELASGFTEWCGKSKRYKVDLSLPRFKAEYGTGLKQTLQALGVKNAFSPLQADFSGISKESLCIGNVLHKTFIKVDEEGAEAAAVTSVMLEATALTPPPETKVMKIDRPFFYAIRESSTGNILFIGKVGHPKE